MSPQNKPVLPKVPNSKKSQMITEKVNHCLKQEFQRSENITDTHNMIYCAALSVCFLMSISISDGSSATTRVKSEPPWKFRIEGKINKLRKSIGILTQYFRDPNHASANIKTKVKQLSYFARLKHWKNDYIQKLKLYLENLKQKVAALGFKLRRYNKRVKRYKQNREFYVNQKRFYRNLMIKQNHKTKVVPSASSLYNFWNKVWGISKFHNPNARWIQEEIQRMDHVPMMNNIQISTLDILHAIKYTNNWKSPGTDHIHNYWLKHFTNVHPVLARQFQDCIVNPSLFPTFLTEGVTYLLPKNDNIDNPANYRPISCLSTMYKLLTSVIKSKIYAHVHQNNILAKEKNGVRPNANGTKELLIFDTVISKQVKIRNKNISIAWIDYIKAYDSVPHSWLIEVLKIYKVDEKVIEFLRMAMTSWSTHLSLKLTNHNSNEKGKNNTQEIRTERMYLKNGIYQGDSLSSLWFCLALNPISNQLNTHPYGYKLDKTDDSKISHLFYMDDLKLYAQNENQLQSQLEIVSNVSNDIGMSFGLDKCNILNVKHGKIVQSNNVKLMNNVEMKELERNQTYKYLGLQQNLNINESDTKKQFAEKFIERVKIIMNTELYSKNKILAINAWAVPVIAYTFGVINWSRTDLQALNRKVRTIMTQYRSHHPQSAVERLYLPRLLGGRGLLDLEAQHAKEIDRLRKYFDKKIDPFIIHVKKEDKYTPLKLSTAYSIQFNFILL
ncbi:hypothetical protein M8J77_007609 [Diaphorina citri]|nr:hypothetical protein M8J77_007609 [Diaphorina citri]